MGAFSLTHLLILAVIVLIFLKPKRLTDLGSSVGKSIKNFKQAKDEIEVEVISEENKKT